MVLDDIFLFLHNTGLARNHAIFSSDYLGHSPRYYDYLRCSGASPSLRSLLRVAMRLSDLAQDKGRADAATLAQRAMSAALARCR